MIESNRKDFFKLLAGVYAFYAKEFSEFAGNVWWEAMQPYDFTAVRQAFNRHAVNPDAGQFLPKPADIVKMLQGSTQDSALVAWAKVDRAIRIVGTYRSVVFDDPLIHRVITEMGGWIQLGTKTTKEWPFLENEFVNRYRGYRMRSEIPEFPPVLVGISESSNAENNREHTEPPTLIGDSVRAQKVMLAGSNKQILGVTKMDPAAAAQALRLVDSRSTKKGGQVKEREPA